MRRAKDYYELLEVHPKARQEIIEKAYRVLVRAYHPDLQPPEHKAQAEEMMRLLNEAYQVLSDPEKRAEYDRLMGFARLYETGPLPKEVKCFNHPKVVAIAECEVCHRPICRECFLELDGKVYCLPCAAREYVPPPPTPTLREPKMGWAGTALFYLGFVLYAGLLGWALMILLAPREAQTYRWFLYTLLLAATGGALTLFSLHLLRRARCPRCGAVISQLRLRMEAPWSEFWRPTSLCPACGHPLQRADFRWVRPHPR